MSHGHTWLKTAIAFMTTNNIKVKAVITHLWLYLEERRAEGRTAECAFKIKLMRKPTVETTYTRAGDRLITAWKWGWEKIRAKMELSEWTKVEIERTWRTESEKILPSQTFFLRQLKQFQNKPKHLVLIFDHFWLERSEWSDNSGFYFSTPETLFVEKTQMLWLCQEPVP